MSAEPIEVRPLTASDVPLVVRVHLSAFSDSALSQLGAEAVCRNYLSLHQGPHELVALGAFKGRDLVGFCYGGVLRGELSYFLLTNRWFLVRRVATHPWLIRNPLLRDRLKLALRLLRRPERMTDRPEDVQAPSTRSFGIQAIAVDRTVQRQGVGRMLMDATEQAARGIGFSRMHLTVHLTNAAAIRFYQNVGWTQDRTNGEVLRKSLTAISGVDQPGL
jgi:ribosomal protein S18 acetylase RimI-like enzyme